MGLKIVSDTIGHLDLTNPGHLVGLGSAVVLSTAATVYSVKKIKERRRLAQLVKRKRAERQATFDDLKVKYVLTQERQAILSIPIHELIAKLQSREVTAVEVLEAFIAKSLEVTAKINCVTEYIPQAVEWAQTLDKLPVVKGPLHGIPFAVKDDHDIKGMDTTLGYAKFLYQPVGESAAIVKVLRDLGGVPFCRTNIPMSEMRFGSHNPVFGTTLNCHFPERHLSPGGSSSGSGALVGGGGAIFALGSDLAGSVRVPAHFNGICGLRPTIGRLCSKGMGTSILPGIVGVRGVSGFLTPFPSQLALLFKSVVESDLQRKYDGTTVPIPWNGNMFTSTRSLRIGYYTSLTIFPPVGSIEKTVLEAKHALEHRGHVLVPFELPSEEEFNCSKLLFDFFFGDLGQGLRELQYGEQSTPALSHLKSVLNLPIWARRLGACVLKWVPGCGQVVFELRAGFDVDTGRKMWAAMIQREAIVRQVLESMAGLQLDLILCPAFAFPALGVDEFHRVEVFNAGCYTWFWNLVDMPAGIVRFGTETGDGTASDPRGEGNPGWELANKVLPNSIGMPIGVQVVGKRFEEELVLRLMSELDDIYQLKLKEEK